MTIVRIRKIIWDKQNTEHIKKHDVTIKEVETIVESDVNITEGYSGKRLLTGNVIYIVTTRDASTKERKEYYEFEKNKQIRKV